MAEPIRMPRDPRRELEWAGPVDVIMRQVSQYATSARCLDFECGYEIVGRTLLAREPKPRPDDTVRWYFRAARHIQNPLVNPRQRAVLALEVYGESVVLPGGDHQRGCGLAAVEFLAKLGVHVTMIDLGADA